MSETKYWIWLTAIFGYGTIRLRQIADICGSAKAAYEMIVGDDAHISVTPNERDRAARFTPEMAQAVIEKSERNGIGIIDYDSPYYPEPLRNIADPPAVLYYIGNIACLTAARTVTAVGTRKASDYSLNATRTICGQLAAQGIIIASGFAVGTDITAHLAAADQGRPTVCVLGCGLDRDYPKENAIYRENIISAGGVLLSEYPMGVRPLPGNFPRRNRILSALGRAALVFQASEKSGSLITARLAADQGRTVYALPPADIFDPAYSGNCALLREGATPLLDSGDVLSAFVHDSEISRKLREEAFELLRRSAQNCLSAELGNIEIPEPKPMPTFEEDDTLEIKFPTSPKKAPEVREKTAPKADPANELQSKIIEYLSERTADAEEIAMKLDAETADVMSELTEMEIFGIVRSLPGKIYTLA